MKVTLLAHTPEPEKMVAAAARLCYSNAQDVETLLAGLANEKVDKFLEKLGEMVNHGTPYEHPVFTFAIEGVSRALTHQLVRHRIASFDQQSQRYTNSEGFGYVIPPSIMANDELRIKMRGICGEINKFLHDCENAGIPKEDARFLLPNATESRLLCTMNARSLAHFFSLRCCARAQWEIRQLANEMFKLAKEAAPRLFVDAAACDQLGYCPEGHMSCGKKPTLEELKKAYTLMKFDAAMAKKMTGGK